MNFSIKYFLETWQEDAELQKVLTSVGTCSLLIAYLSNFTNA